MTDFTPARLAELRAVAEAAFPVEDWAIWSDLKEGGFVHVGNAQGVIPEGQFVTAEDAEPNPVAKAYTPELGAHIATFDPPTVLALIAALEAETAEVEMWTKPQECVTEHEQPFDFKQCTTHDRTFPLDGDCDYKGLSIIDWQDQQVAEQRGRAVRAEMRAERAEAALERVKALHHDAGESQGYTPEVRGGYGTIPHCCASCGTFGEYGEPWPCATIQAIEGDLTGL